MFKKSLLLCIVVLVTTFPRSAFAATVESAGGVPVFSGLEDSAFAWGEGAIATYQDGAGYWVATDRGEVLSFGTAEHFGDMAETSLNEPVVGMAPLESGNGYWLVARDGGIFSFGAAEFFGSTGGMELNSPIVGMAATNTGGGYWLVAADGGVFSFGDAVFRGSTGDLDLNRPIVGILPTATDKGYWLLADDGGIFTFGDATFHGSAPGRGLRDTFAGLVPSSQGDGYALVHTTGKITPFGTSALESNGSCVVDPVTDAVAAGDGALLLRAPRTVPAGPASSKAASVDSAFLTSLIRHSQGCQTQMDLAPKSLAYPLEEPVKTSSFGWRYHPIWGNLQIHNGIDFIGPNGTSGGAAWAVTAGKVIFSGDLVAYGKTVVLDHGGKIATIYGHLRDLPLSLGNEVTTHEAVGMIGTTGLSTGPHLHFELRVEAEPLNPEPFFAAP